MKRMICEMCGGTEIVKTEGVFVCQSCGCKYTIDEAKKMLIEGKVDVSGSTVKVDVSNELENLYQLARRAKEDDNFENATKYYDMILVRKPNSWEASFFSIYFKAMACKIGQIRSAAISINNCLENVLELIRDNVPEEKQAAAVETVMWRCSYAATTLANAAKNHYDGIDSEIREKYLQEYVDNVVASRNIMYTCGTQIDQIFTNKKEIAKLAADAWKAGIELHKTVLPYFKDKEGNQKVIDSYGTQIGKYDQVYAYRQKKAALEKEISALKREMSSVKFGDISKKGRIGLAAVFLFSGVIWFLISADLGYLIGFVNLLIGGLIAWSIPKGRTAEEIKADQQERTADLNLQIDAKQKELNDINEKLGALR